MVSFGIRNMPDVPRLFREAKRVLKDGGQFAVLEFSIPRNPLIRFFYLFYFTRILPWLGELVSGETGAYRHLRDSVLGFYRPEEVEALLREAEFVIVRSRPITFGISRVYLAESPSIT
jgi:ubiquinone/menaquinone biosynthesis C-methylase UbiE